MSLRNVELTAVNFRPAGRPDGDKSGCADRLAHVRSRSATRAGEASFTSTYPRPPRAPYRSANRRGGAA